MPTTPTAMADGLTPVEDAFDPAALPPEVRKLHAEVLAALDPADWPAVRADGSGAYQRAGEVYVGVSAYSPQDGTAKRMRIRADEALVLLRGCLALAAALEVAEAREDEESAQAAALALTGATNVDDIPADVLDRVRAAVRSGAVVVRGTR